MGWNRSKVGVLAVICLAIFTMVVWGLLKRDTGHGGGLRVGVALPLTGDAAVYGQAIKDGIELAAEQDDTEGQRIVLIFEDDRGVPRDAISAVRRLIDVERTPVIIGGAMSSTAEPIIPVIDQAQVTLISPTATKPNLPGMSRYFFRLWPSDDYDGKVMAEAAYNDLGLRRVAVLYVNVAYGVGITDVFTREFRSLGGEIVSSEGYRQGATDFRTLLTRIAAENPDAIYLPGYVAEISNILRQAQELDLGVSFLGVNSMYDPQLLELAGAAAEGAVFTYPTFDVQSSDAAIEGFVSAFRKRYGRAPDAFAAQGYDAYRIIEVACERSPHRTGPALRDALLSLGSYSGPGGEFEFTADGDVEKPLRLMTVHNGQFTGFRGDRQ